MLYSISISLFFFQFLVPQKKVCHSQKYLRYGIVSMSIIIQKKRNNKSTCLFSKISFNCQSLFRGNFSNYIKSLSVGLECWMYNYLKRNENFKFTFRLVKKWHELWKLNFNWKSWKILQGFFALMLHTVLGHLKLQHLGLKEEQTCWRHRLIK